MKTFVCLGLVLTFAACAGDPAILSVTANPSTVAKGGITTLTVEAENVELGAHEDHAALTAARALRTTHGDEEEEGEMHLHTYLDSLESNPLAQTSSTTFPVAIPLPTASGAHQLIVRLHNGDHTILEPQVTFPVTITVQ